MCTILFLLGFKVYILSGLGFVEIHIIYCSVLRVKTRKSSNEQTNIRRKNEQPANRLADQVLFDPRANNYERDMILNPWAINDMIAKFKCLILPKYEVCPASVLLCHNLPVIEPIGCQRNYKRKQEYHGAIHHN